LTTIKNESGRMVVEGLYGMGWSFMWIYENFMDFLVNHPYIYIWKESSDSKRII
jgi:hypothetical protein